MKNVIRKHIVIDAAKRFKFFSEGGDCDESAMRKALTSAIGLAKVSGWYDGPSVRAIEADIEHPEFTGRRGARPKYPMWKMEVGDVLEISGVHKMDVQAAARSYGHRHGKKFLVDGEKGNMTVIVKRVT